MAALLPGSLAILTAAFPDPRERVQAIGRWSGVSAMALAAGVVLVAAARYGGATPRADPDPAGPPLPAEAA